MKRLLLIAVAVLMLISCKNGKAEKTIVGTWTEVKADGVDIPVGDQGTIQFTKVKGGEGDMIVKNAYGSVPEEYVYQIKEGGSKLVFESVGGIVNIKRTKVIAELTDHSLIIDWGLGEYIGSYTK